MKNRITIGIIIFGLITLALVSFMPRYQPNKRDILFNKIDSLETEIEVLQDINIKQQMQIRFKL